MTTAPTAPPAEAQFLAVDAPVQVLESGEGKAKRREVAGLVLPYGVELNRPHWSGASRQLFAQGSAKVRDNATLYYGHDHLNRKPPVGRWIDHAHTDAGLTGRARFADTPKADEVYALTKPDEDGKAILDRFSAGFYEVAGHLEDDGDLYVHDEVDVFEKSLVPDPAFAAAAVDDVLNRSTHPSPPGANMTATTLSAEDRAVLDNAASAEDVQTLSASITDLERRIATLGTGNAGDADAVQVPGESYGEFLQMLAGGDRAAVDFLAYVGGTTGDLGDVLKDSWVGERFRKIEERRRVLNFFARSPLPATGMGVEYGVVGTDTTQVGKQAAEGDVLPYGKITFATDRAALETFGGWGEMTRQEIERSPINVVERFFNALLNRYAQATEAEVHARALAAGTALSGGVLDLSTAEGWTRYTIRAARALADTGYPLEAHLVGYDVFEEVATIKLGADGPYLLDRNTGQINVTGPSGNILGVQIIPIETGATTDVVRSANSEAIRTYEASGAPFRLQDDDITNLTKAFSVYGYMADAEEVPEAIVKPATV